MPAKYSHIKKRSTTAPPKKGGAKDGHGARPPNPHVDKSISQAMFAVSQLERAIARVLLLRYEQDIARLYSTRLYGVSLVYLPTFVMRCLAIGGPSWLVYNHNCEEIKDFFRGAISMDMRQAGERVATKSVLWSYTALRHFALSNDVDVCPKRGLHSLRLLPFYASLDAHVQALEAMPPASFSKPPHLGSLQEGFDILEDACELKYGRSHGRPSEWDTDWRIKVRLGYERLSQTLWRVAREFNVRGYGSVLREKLTTKWCDCGCSTDHLGEVCERTVREEEEESGVRLGKQREWDGRGSGVFGWETENEEDIWDVDLDFAGAKDRGEGEMTIGEVMEWRYLRAEREKEEGNAAFRKGDFDTAVKRYEAAYQIEPEIPHYQLNLAAAHLKLNNWMEAEKACTNALGQQRSSKGYFRRARARRMLSRPDDAIKDLRSVLKLQPTNAEALAELTSLLPMPIPAPIVATSSSSSSKQPPDTPNESLGDTLERLGVPRPRQPKQPPFLPTKADSRRIKIVLLPAPATDERRHELEHGGQPCAHPNHCRRHGNGKLKEKSERAREIEEMRRGVLRPSWDRYAIHKAE